MRQYFLLPYVILTMHRNSLLNLAIPRKLALILGFILNMLISGTARRQGDIFKSCVFLVT